MGLENLANLSQIIGALAVIGSLFYVAKQLKYTAQQVADNTSAVKAATYQAVSEQVISIAYAISSNAELASFVQRVGRLKDEQLEDPADVLRWEAYAYSIFRNLDNIYYQHTLGTVSKPRMKHFVDPALQFNFQYPRIRDYWLRAGPIFHDDFCKYADNILKELKGK